MSIPYCCSDTRCIHLQAVHFTVQTTRTHIIKFKHRHRHRHRNRQRTPHLYQPPTALPWDVRPIPSTPLASLPSSPTPPCRPGDLCEHSAPLFCLQTRSNRKVSARARPPTGAPNKRYIYPAPFALHLMSVKHITLPTWLLPTWFPLELLR